MVVCTYNRADRLPLALEALLAQEGSVPYEILVIDNNSTDSTAEVVQAVAQRAGGRVRSALESRQGLSHARNAGIGLARGSIIAFSDDDVRVAKDWVRQIKKTFDEHAEIDYIGGRVLPHWMQSPPAWLTTAHWSPLALQDYGPDVQISGRARAICLVGANLAFRRGVFETVGLFTPALGRIRDGIGSTEDHDLQLRAWRAGLRGLYSPSVVATADVTPDRMVRSYHRRWHRGHGRHCAMMRLRELVPADLGPMSEPADIVTLFGSPAFVYADMTHHAWRWVGALARRKDTFFYGNQLRHLWNYVKTGYERFSREKRRSVAMEVATFLRRYARKRLRWGTARA